MKFSRRSIPPGLLVLLNLGFIWGNSLLPGQVSGEISNQFLICLREILGPALEIGGFLLRKLAHFSEFALLGLLLAWLFSTLGKPLGIPHPLLFGILSALTDETIQVFVPQRGPSVVDVWIDTAGVLAGIILFLLGYSIYCKKKQMQSGGKTE